MQADFYHGFCRGYLRPILHNQLVLPGHEDPYSEEEWRAYCTVNKKFAEKARAARSPHLASPRRASAHLGAPHRTSPHLAPVVNLSLAPSQPAEGGRAHHPPACPLHRTSAPPPIAGDGGVRARVPHVGARLPSAPAALVHPAPPPYGSHRPLPPFAFPRLRRLSHHLRARGASSVRRAARAMHPRQIHPRQPDPRQLHPGCSASAPRAPCALRALCLPAVRCSTRT
jgi:hypothetical protein